MKRILVIDDDNEGTSILKITLEKKGYACEHVFEDENIMEVIESFKPNLIVIDVFPENRSGNKMVKKLKCNAEISHIPIFSFFSNRFESDPNTQEAADKEILTDELYILIRENLLKNKN